MLKKERECLKALQDFVIRLGVFLCGNFDTSRSKL